MTDLSGMTTEQLLATYQKLKANRPAGKVYAMPGGVTNKLNEDMEGISVGSATNARIEPYRHDLENKRLDLGPVRNLFMGAQNWMGASTPESRNYSNFRGDLEKMRNDSLRLNKGVQTEGDAVRAWNELMKNLNDEQLVAARLKQIQSYNDEAIRQKKVIVSGTRRQYGQPEPEYGQLETPRAKFMPQRPPPKAAAPAADPRKMTDEQLRKSLGY